MGKMTAAIRVADEVWIATALLHQEHPERPDFSLREIEARLTREAISEQARPGVSPHISVHCVANRPPNGGTYRMLFETAPSRRRLYRAGDPFDPRRRDGKVMPSADEIPSAYHALLEWYGRAWVPQATSDPLLDLAARYRGLWTRVNPDDYVRQLREGFE